MRTVNITEQGCKSMSLFEKKKGVSRCLAVAVWLLLSSLDILLSLPSLSQIVASIRPGRAAYQWNPDN